MLKNKAETTTPDHLKIVHSNKIVNHLISLIMT